MVHNIPQPTFEDFLAKRLAQDGKVEIRKGHSFVSCKQASLSIISTSEKKLILDQTGDRVITTIEDRDSKRLYEVCSTHVAACDGARSRVRETLGIECEGELTRM